MTSLSSFQSKIKSAEYDKVLPILTYGINPPGSILKHKPEHKPDHIIIPMPMPKSKKHAAKRLKPDVMYIETITWHKINAVPITYEYIKDINVSELEVFYELSDINVIESFINIAIPYSIIYKFNKGYHIYLIEWIETKLGQKIDISFVLTSIEEYIETYFCIQDLYTIILNEGNYKIITWNINIRKIASETDFDLVDTTDTYINVELHHGFCDDENVLSIKLDNKMYRIYENTVTWKKNDSYITEAFMSSVLSLQNTKILTFIYSEYIRLTRNSWDGFI